jgi:putative ABC transport system permease protein
MLPRTVAFAGQALDSLARNKLQTGLALLGVSIGVGALVTSIGLGRGARQAIDAELRAAGANLIVVTSGNYRPQADPQEDSVGDETWLDDIHGPNGDAGPRMVPVHFEDDPTALHDHPTAKQRLGDASAGLGAAATLTRADAAAILREIPGIQHVAPGVHENVRVYAGPDEKGPVWFTRLHGTDVDLAAIRTGWLFPHGSFLTEQQVESGAQVIVLGRIVADRLFGNGSNPVGQIVKVWHQAFRVTGVIGTRSWATQPAPGDDQFDAVYVPVTTVHRLLNLSKLNTITLTTISVGDTTAIAKRIVALLRRRHHISENAADDFIVRTQAQQVLGHGLPPQLARLVTGNLSGVDSVTIAKLGVSMERANATMLWLLVGVATVSLVVGGVGLMNLLLLSVTQRTREVGVRMALGARRADVVLQFVAEAVVLSVAGGLLGTVIGVFAASGLAQLFHWSIVVSPLIGALGMLAAAVLGVLFGVYPARRAAGIDPIEALRYE